MAKGFRPKRFGQLDVDIFWGVHRPIINHKLRALNHVNS